MPQTVSFISFHDLSTDGRFLWASPTVYDVLGYEAEELVGRCGYDIVYPEDQSQGKEFHKETFINDLVASQIVVRYRGKDGRPVPCVCVISLCYDFLVNSATVLDQTAEAYLKRRAHSSLMTSRVGSKKEEFERMKRHHDAFAANTWDHQMMEPEARVCLILNRFTRSLIVIYASSACEKVFHVDPDDITGKPILLYIRADDLAPFVQQVDLTKSSTSISQMRFWFQSPNWPREIPCEAMIFGAADGIVAIVRRCKPFVRKHLIESREHSETRYGKSTWLYRWNQSYGSSPNSELSASPSSPWNQSYGSSPNSELSASPSSPPTFGDYASRSTAYRNVSRASLDRIKILELDEERARPISSLPEDDPYLMHEKTAASEVPAFKEVIVQHFDEEDEEDGEDDIGVVVRGVAISKLDDDGVGP
ncbi:MAG: hypothetical protein J3Q66DRAFT_384514 [Benniella sp.]|nr:MAG: hypothetical protein J3Q66DRAFT_384514 [Benniella sp.]